MIPELAGYTVGVTAARRADELEALLARRGASVLHGPAIRIVPLADDSGLHAATERLCAEPPDVVVATTGIGFRGWIEAAEGWGIGADLLRVLGSATVLARGPKAKGAVRTAGLVEAWSPESESGAEMLEQLLRSGVDGQRIAIQLHGEPLPEFTRALRAAGADVLELPVYRWVRPADPAPLERLLDGVVSRQVDALAFTSAPAAANLLRTAERLGRRRELLDALREDVLVACVGGICARPLAAHGVSSSIPPRARLGSLARMIAESLPSRARRMRIADSDVELRGQAAIVDGQLRSVPPTPMALLRVLAANPGRVVSRRELLAALPNGGEAHAVETAIARLRGSLGVQRIVQTVVKRGYRLAVEEVPV